LESSLAAAGISRDETYVTNAVKHFKWEPRGKRRLHAKPSAREITACKPWLEAEMQAVRPQTIVCLGATAAQALLGRAFRITRQRGELLPSLYSKWILATYHPSAVLRAPEAAERRRLKKLFMDDLRTAAKSILQSAPR
jgi:DNA polymerase